MDNLKIRKKDGELEYWNYDKLIASIIKVGIDSDLADKMAKEIQKWASENQSGGIIDSDLIRDKVIEVLGKSDPISKDTYRNYKK